MIFFVLAAAGVVFVWCFFGAWEGYKRTAAAMNTIEDDLGLTAMTKAPGSHMHPYLCLLVFGILVSFAIATYPEALIGDPVTEVEIVGGSQPSAFPKLPADLLPE